MVECLVDCVLVEMYRFDIVLVVVGVIEAAMCRVVSRYVLIRIVAFLSVMCRGIWLELE